MTASARFARFATRVRLADVPRDTVRRAGLHLLDTLGAALAGSASVEAGLARRAARAEGGLGTGPAAIWGTAGRARPQTAAFVNGVAAHAFELDDSGGCDHSGAVVVPAALAAVAVAGRPVTGAELTLAVLLGYELGRRVQTALGGYDAVNERGWHSTGVCGTFAAAAAAGRVLGLDAEALTWAIGLAGSFTGGTWAFVGDSAMSKRLHVGRAAECGLHAALLAREGFTGPAAVFEAGWGGVLGLYAGPGVADPAAISGGLGEHWQLDRSSIKPYASCRSTHSTIDAVLRLREQGLRAERVDALEVHASELIVQMCGGADLSSLVSAQLSLPFAVAVAAVRGDVGLDDILAGRTDPGVLDLLDRVALHTDPGQHGGSAEPWLRVTGGGRSLTAQAVLARGAAENRLSAAQIRAKFDHLAAHRLPGEARRRLIAGLDRLGECPDVAPLIGLLAATDEPRPLSWNSSTNTAAAIPA